MTFHLKEHSLRHFNHRTVHRHENFCNVLLELSDILLFSHCRKLDVFKAFCGHFKESVLWPLTEPVNGGAVYICREHTEPIPERFPDRAHAENDMEVISDSLNEVGKHGVWYVLDPVFLSISSESLSYLRVSH